MKKKFKETYQKLTFKKVLKWIAIVYGGLVVAGLLFILIVGLAVKSSGGGDVVFESIATGLKEGTEKADKEIAEEERKEKLAEEKRKEEAKEFRAKKEKEARDKMEIVFVGIGKTGEGTTVYRYKVYNAPWDYDVSKHNRKETLKDGTVVKLSYSKGD